MSLTVPLKKNKRFSFLFSYVLEIGFLGCLCCVIHISSYSNCCLESIMGKRAVRFSEVSLSKKKMTEIEQSVREMKKGNYVTLEELKPSPY